MNAGANLQHRELLLLEFPLSAKLLDIHPLRRQLSLDRFLRNIRLLPLDFRAVQKFVGDAFRRLYLDIGRESLLTELRLDVGVEFGLCSTPSDTGRSGLLIEPLALQLYSQIRVRRFARL